VSPGRFEKPEWDDHEEPDRDVGGSLLPTVQKSWHLVGAKGRARRRVPGD
jgi:hypothetical protein